MVALTLYFCKRYQFVTIFEHVDNSLMEVTYNKN